MNRLFKPMLALLAMFAVSGAAVLSVRASTAPSSSVVAVGAPAPQFTLQDEAGKPVSLSDYTGKVVVLEWTNPECPFVKRHYAEKTMTTLANDYKNQGVIWLAINSTSTATNAGNKAWVVQNSLAYPVLNDSTGSVGHLYGAKSTPDMFVINKEGKLVYSGAIDNDRDGTMAANARINYVKKALDETLAGSTVSTPETKSYGCAVHYAK